MKRKTKKKGRTWLDAIVFILQSSSSSSTYTHAHTPTRKRETQPKQNKQNEYTGTMTHTYRKFVDIHHVCRALFLQEGGDSLLKDNEILEVHTQEGNTRTLGLLEELAIGGKV
jgi:hypothetical protein